MREPGPPLVERIFRLCWRLYPRAFREEHGQDALELFRDSLADRRSRGWTGLFAARALLGLVVHGVAERAASLVRGAHGTGAAARTLLRAPGPSLTMASILALGIGGATLVFALVESVLLQPLPYPEPHRLVDVTEANEELGIRLRGPSPGDLLEWQAAGAGFEGLAGWYVTSATFRDPSRAEELASARATDRFFEVLGVEARLGRTFETDEVARNGPAAVLSDAAWRRLYGADPGAVGSVMELNGEGHTVLGVMPPSFAFPDEEVEIWTAWDLRLGYAHLPEVPREQRFLGVAGRLAPGVSQDDAAALLAAVQGELERAHPATNAGWTISLRPLEEAVVGDLSRPLWAALGGVSLILLAAALNVALLMLARVPVRRREIALRASLGAGRAEIARQLLQEALLLGLAAGLAGLALARLALGLLQRTAAPGWLPADPALDPVVAGFALLVSLLTVALFALAPMVETLRVEPAHVLRSADGRVAGGPSRSSDLFVVAEVAVSVVLLASATLLGLGVREVLHRDPGFDTSGSMVFRLAVDVPAGEGPAWTARFYEDFLGRLGEIPGVEAVGAGQVLPLHLGSTGFTRPYRLPGTAVESVEAPEAWMRIVDPGYFRAIGTPLLAGDGFTGDERLGDPWVVVVNRRLAESLWPGRSPIGESLELDYQGGWYPYRVVGVVPEARHGGLQRPAVPEAYLSHRQIPYLAMSVVLRAEDRGPALLEAVRGVAAASDPPQPVYAFASMEELVDASLARERLLLAALGVFSALSLVLTASGVYGVMALTVRLRLREMGVRLALGARPAQVRGLVLGRAAWLGALGVGVGTAGGALAAFAVRAVLADAGGGELAALTVSGALLLATALLAALVPALRAGRGDPVSILR